jgi:hypothetical protein
MAFKLAPEARNYFKNIEKNYKTDLLDIFYFCFLVGYKHNYSYQLPRGSNEFNKRYTEKFRDKRGIFLGMLILLKLRKGSLDLSAYDDVRRTIVGLVEEHNFESYLSEDGFENLNEFAYGGFLKLKERHPDSPTDLFYLLMDINTIVTEA